MFYPTGNAEGRPWSGGICWIDLADQSVGETVISDLDQPHSVEVIERDIHSCESLAYEVGREGKTLVSYNGYTRGLEWDGQYYYIGQSKMEHFERVPAEVTHTSCNSGLHIFDPVAEVEHFIELKCDNIYSILTLS